MKILRLDVSKQHDEGYKGIYFEFAFNNKTCKKNIANSFPQNKLKH